MTLIESLKKAASRLNMTLPGLLFRISARSLLMLPGLIKGSLPFMLKLKITPLAALHTIIKKRLCPDAARDITGEVLYAAAAMFTRKSFRTVGHDTPIPDILHLYDKAFQGPGKHQKVKFEKRMKDGFRFAITDCMHVRVLEHFGLGDIAFNMCDADRSFWEHTLCSSRTLFSKDKNTIARGGQQCSVEFSTEKPEVALHQYSCPQEELQDNTALGKQTKEPIRSK
ncbi:L-2-amino-thiazoline-4-carboxylic acid hydrolase [Planctomycetota bacterium]